METNFGNYASKGVGGTALGLSIGALGVEALRGGLGGLFGGGGAVCNENMPVTRYELSQQKEITDRDAEIAYLKGRDAAKTDSLELYKYVDGRFRGIEAQIASQAVVNAQITANIGCMQTAIAGLQALTKTVIPIGNVCPEPMPAYNSWTAPTTTTAAG
jgi:hypothetical protein